MKMLDSWIQLINISRRHYIVMLFMLTCLSVFTSPTSTAEITKNIPPTKKILILGDSLSAEYGLTRGTGWVSLLDKRLQKEKLSAQTINASISGETTAGGLSRLSNLLHAHQPHIVIIELGANDGLRGLQLQPTENNLKKIIQLSKASGASVLILGMRIPPNYGPDYTNKFFNMYGKLAREEQISYIPFFLDKVSDKLELFQADHIHPNEQAQTILLENVWKELRKLLDEKKIS